MKNLRIYFPIIITAMASQFSLAQEETIGSEVVNVVKPYTPTISDAFKVKETPTIEDDTNTQKEEVKYNIFSFPVASTFTPAKGKAAGVDKETKERIYNNYATIGAGNYGTVNAEFFVTKNFSRNSYIGGMLRHLSSQGGIKDAVLDDNYANTAFDLTYGNRSRDINWNADLGIKHNTYNWYGLPIDDVMFDDAIRNAIDPKQNHTTIALGGRAAMSNSFFSEAAMQFKRFSDAFGSGENRFWIQPNFDVEILDYKIDTDVIVDYVGGSFNSMYENETAINYSNLIFGAKPSFLYQQDDLSVQIGAGLFYGIGKINNENEAKFFVYPNVKASYKIVGDLLIGYAGAEGGLHQNSYADFVAENPFVSPTLFVGPTDNKYDVYAGLKGKLTNSVSFNIRGSYNNQENKPLFSSNPTVLENTNTEGYAYGNSFNVVYDNVKTISFYGEIKGDFSEKVSLGLNGTFNSFSTNTQDEAWNLPELKIGANLEVTITKKWYAGTNIFFVGERKDIITIPTDAAVVPILYTQKQITLDSYFDLNAHIGYKYNERLTAFLRGNNLANQQYNRWVNYPVQGIQVLLGASYKFDF
ncbi:TonB-dependent receptor [Flavobacterium sp.]|uniref:TonB-dependent receptor n=1 Tax=Flavobacterium sp. TaxID=239 RepID=UPI003529C3CF